MPDEVKRQILRLEVDQTAVKKAISDTDRLNQTVANLRKETLASTRQMGPAEAGLVKYGKSAQIAGREVDTLRAKLDKTEKALKTNRKELDASAQSAKSYEKELRAIRENAGSYGDVETSSRAITGAIGYLGGNQIERTANIGNELLAATEGVKRLGGELPKLVNQMGLAELSSSQLALGFGVAAVAAAGVALAVDALSDSAKKSREAVLAQIQFEQDLANLRITGKTTDQLKAEADALKENIDARAQQISNLQLEKFELKDNENLLQGVGRVLGVYNAGLSDVDKELSNLIVQQQADVKLWNEINDALDDNTVAANDAAEAERELSDTRTSLAIRGTQIQIRATQMTAEQLDARLEQIETEQRFYGTLQRDLEALAAVDENYAEGLAQVQEITGALAQEERLLGQARAKIRPEVAALAKLHEDSVASYDDAKKAFAESTAAAEKWAETVAKRQLQVLQTAQKRALQLAQDEEEFNIGRARDIADHYAVLAEIDRDFYADRGQIIQDAIADLADNEQERADELVSLNKDLQDLAEDHARSMRRIARDANRDEAKASRRLDAVALADAQKARKDAIEDENDQYADEKSAREDQFRERLELLDRERQETVDAQRQALRDLEAQHQKERAENIRAFNEEIAREDQDRRVKLQHQQQQFALEDAQQRQQWALEDAQRRNAFNTQTAQTSAHLNNTNAIVSNGLTRVENRFAASMNRLASSASITVSTTRAIQVRSGSRQVQPFAAGGYPPTNKDVLVGEYGPEIARFQMPTRIYPAGVRPPSRGIGTLGEGAIQINITGSTSPQLTARMVGEVVDRKLAEYWSN